MERTNDLLVAAFAEVLRERRQNAGLSQDELAARADVSRAMSLSSRTAAGSRA